MNPTESGDLRDEPRGAIELSVPHARRRRRNRTRLRRPGMARRARLQRHLACGDDVYAVRPRSVRGRFRDLGRDRRARQRHQGHRGDPARRRAAAACGSPPGGRPAGVRRAEGPAPCARGRTGCGVCGIESIDLLDLAPERVPDTGFRPPRPRRADACGAGAAGSPGAHAAHGRPACGRVVRRNRRDPDGIRGRRPPQRTRQADRLARAVARRRDRRLRVPVEPRELRAVRKAARVGIPLVATISAPSSLAIEIAKAAGLRLVSFCRETGHVDYGTA